MFLISDFVGKCIGPEAKYEGIRLLFDGLQQPILNKQVNHEYMYNRHISLMKLYESCSYVQKCWFHSTVTFKAAVSYSTHVFSSCVSLSSKKRVLNVSLIKKKTLSRPFSETFWNLHCLHQLSVFLAAFCWCVVTSLGALPPFVGNTLSLHSPVYKMNCKIPPWNISNTPDQKHHWVHSSSLLVHFFWDGSSCLVFTKVIFPAENASYATIRNICGSKNVGTGQHKEYLLWPLL